MPAWRPLPPRPTCSTCTDFARRPVRPRRRSWRPWCTRSTPASLGGGFGLVRGAVLGLGGALGLGGRRPFGHANLLLRFGVDAGLGLLARRRQHHQHVAAVLLGRGFDEAVFGHVVGQLLQQVEAEFWTALLATPEHDGDLHLVAGLEKADHVTLLGLVIVAVDLGPQLHFFDHGVGLVASALTGLLGGLVLELAVVHELGDRRAGHRRHLHQVEIGLAGEPQGVLDADDADLFAGRPDQAHLVCMDALVDPWFADFSSRWSQRLGCADCCRPCKKAPAQAEAPRNKPTGRGAPGLAG